MLGQGEELFARKLAPGLAAESRQSLSQNSGDPRVFVQILWFVGTQERFQFLATCSKFIAVQLGFFVQRSLSRQGPSRTFHVQADFSETFQDGVRAMLVFPEILESGIGRSVSLPVGLGLTLDESSLFEKRQGWIDHSGTGHVKTVRTIIKLPDEFVTMGRLVLQQGKQNELQFLR
jgi:hypothetical protein